MANACQGCCCIAFFYLLVMLGQWFGYAPLRLAAGFNERFPGMQSATPITISKDDLARVLGTAGVVLEQSVSPVVINRVWRALSANTTSLSGGTSTLDTESESAAAEPSTKDGTAVAPDAAHRPREEKQDELNEGRPPEDEFSSDPLDEHEQQERASDMEAERQQRKNR